jgi:hypothetical protein
MNGLEPLNPQLDRLQRRSLIVGVAGLALCLVAAPGNPQQFFQSYLQAYLFWIGISLGCLAIVMTHHLVGGTWGVPVRRLLEAGSRTLPLMAVLFVPVLVGMRSLYVWARPQEVAASPLLQQKTLYLNVPSFWIRAAIYFVIWILVAHFLSKWSLEQDRTADSSLTRRLRMLSGPGIVLYGLTVTFSAIDWAMSLEPEWHSTIYGMVFMAGQGLQALAFVIIVSYLLARRGPPATVALPSRFHDLGNLILTFLMLWTYMAFSQFLIVWAENLTDEVPWYLRRTAGGWQGIGIALIVLQFALPFVLLLSRMIKRSAPMLALVALLILFMQLVNLFWLIAPTFHPAALSLHWLDVMTPVGIGGIWIAMFVRQLQGGSLVPLHDPRLEGAVEHAGGV